MAVRKTREKIAARIANFAYPEHPWATLLLQDQTRFKLFANTLPLCTVANGWPQRHTLRQVLTMDPRKVCAIDTSCGTGPWQPYARTPEASQHGRDLFQLSLYFYNEADSRWEWNLSFTTNKYPIPG